VVDEKQTRIKPTVTTLHGDYHDLITPIIVITEQIQLFIPPSCK